MMDKFILLRWPWSQWAMDFDDSALVDTAESDPDGSLELDQAYLVPESRMAELPADVAAEAEGQYAFVDWPDAAACDGDKDAIYDMDGNCYLNIDR